VNGANSVASNGVITIIVCGGDNKLLYSTNGITWTGSASANALLGTLGLAVCWGDKWVAGGYSGPTIYSTDGINWTAGNGSGNLFQIAYNGYMYVGVGYQNFIYSFDGINWTNSPGGALLLDGRSVAWNGKLWVAGGAQVSSAGSILIYSYNGINWTDCNNTASLSSVNANTISWNGSVWIACGAGSTNNNSVLTSVDGINWTVQTSASSLLLSNTSDSSAVRKIPTYPRISNALGGTGQSSAGGSLDVNFNTAIPHPNVTATVSGASPALITVSNVGPTGFSAATYNLSGTQTGPVNFNWTAIP
jgi:hypothetical protein